MNKWHYFPSDKNSADVGTRCVLPKNKSRFLLWIECPIFLQQYESYCPQVPPGCSLNMSDFTVTALCEFKTEVKI